MKQYLLTVCYPAGSTQPQPEALQKIMRDVSAVQKEMQAAGVWVFSGGLHPANTATVLRQQNGEIVTTDGPFIESKEQIGGITVLTAPDLDAAIAWARKLARAIDAPDRGAAVLRGSLLTDIDVAQVFRREYGRAVAVLVRQLGDISLAEEAVQDAFVDGAGTLARGRSSALARGLDHHYRAQSRDRPSAARSHRATSARQRPCSSVERRPTEEHGRA